MAPEIQVKAEGCKFRRFTFLMVVLALFGVLMWMTYMEKLHNVEKALQLFQMKRLRAPPYKVDRAHKLNKNDHGGSTKSDEKSTKILIRHSTTVKPTTTEARSTTQKILTTKKVPKSTTQKKTTTKEQKTTSIETTKDEDDTTEGEKKTEEEKTTEEEDKTTKEEEEDTTKEEEETTQEEEEETTEEVKTTPDPLAGCPEAFKPLMTSKHKEMMIDLLKIFDKEAKKLKIPVFLIAGSLLGVYRHEGFVPWDDDLDIVLPKSDRHRLFKQLTKYKQYKTWTTTGDFQWKFYPVNARKLWTKWKWPFLDVFFYKENSTHIWINEMGKLTYCKKTDIFPLKRAKFDNWMAPVPRNVTKFCQQYFHTIHFEECISNYYLHSYERSNRRDLYKKMPCKDLMPFYHFADRKKNPI